MSSMDVFRLTSAPALRKRLRRSGGSSLSQCRAPRTISIWWSRSASSPMARTLKATTMSMPHAPALFQTSCSASLKEPPGRVCPLAWRHGTRAKAYGSMSRLACVACGARIKSPGGAASQHKHSDRGPRRSDAVHRSFFHRCCGFGALGVVLRHAVGDDWRGTPLRETRFYLLWHRVRRVLRGERTGRPDEADRSEQRVSRLLHRARSGGGQALSRGRPHHWRN